MDLKDRIEFTEQIECLLDENDSLREQLVATQAHAARLMEALEMISGKRQCIDNLLSNIDIANTALSTSINLDALHEDRAQTLITVAEKFEYGCENAPISPGALVGRTLRHEAAAHLLRCFCPVSKTENTVAKKEEKRND